MYGYRADRGWSWLLVRAIWREPVRYCQWVLSNRRQKPKRRFYVIAVCLYCDQERVDAGLITPSVAAEIFYNLTDYRNP